MFVLVAATALIGFALSQTPAPEGHVTSIFHDVQLLPAQADARPAEIDDKVDEGNAVRTGADSRSELTFSDLTIARLGANTIFSVSNAGRSVRLDSGAILLYARKNSGGAQITTKAVTVGITGTTVIFESRADRYDRLTVLEGDARFSLNNFPDQSAEVHAGELLNARAGAKKLPKPRRVDLRGIMRTHPLIKNFPPLPSLDLILAVAGGSNLNRPPLQPQPQPPTGGAGSQGGPSPGYVPPGPPVGPAPLLWWCCIDGQVIQSTEAECRARGGQAFRSEQKARAHCGRACWVCIGGKVVRIPVGDVRATRLQCYASEEEARSHCGGGTWWCCIDGEVVKVPEAQARLKGNQCYRSREEAVAACEAGGKCWCCIDTDAGMNVVQMTRADCQSRGGQCYGSRKEALKNCRGVGKTPTAKPTPIRTPRPVSSAKPSPKPTFTPKKRWPTPPGKRPITPTPTPGPIIR